MKSLIVVIGVLVLACVVSGCGGGGGGGGFSSWGESNTPASGLAGGIDDGASSSGTDDPGPVAVLHNPEPGSLLLMASGLFGLAGFYIKKLRS